MSNFFEVSGSRIMPKNVKVGTHWDFLNIHSVAKYQKIERGPFRDIEKLCKIKSRNAETTSTKIFWSSARLETRTLLLLRRPQKILINLYANCLVWQLMEATAYKAY